MPVVRQSVIDELTLEGTIARDDAVRLGIVMQLRAALPELAREEAGEIRAATALFN